jgi:hypothetical protein
MMPIGQLKSGRHRAISLTIRSWPPGRRALMTRTVLPKLALALLVLIVISVNVGHADPPVVVDPDMLASGGALQVAEPGLEPVPNLAQRRTSWC